MAWSNGFLVFKPYSLVDFVDWMGSVCGGATFVVILLFFLGTFTHPLYTSYVLWGAFLVCLVLINCFLSIKKINSSNHYFLCDTKSTWVWSKGFQEWFLEFFQLLHYSCCILVPVLHHLVMMESHPKVVQGWGILFGSRNDELGNMESSNGIRLHEGL